ncbi:MAG: hypothetical protein JWP47_3100 [Polaromonas sp.]|nr:hypothetical protein [Polaromonas sp.]
MSVTHLLYLHGFRSSPLSAKARTMAETVRQRYPGVVWWCPQLPPSPRQAMHDVATRLAAWPGSAGFEAMAVVGSSLGGFYATWVAETMGCKAVLLNPAVNPARDLASHIGQQTSWQNPADRFFFKAEFLTELRQLERGPLAHPERYLALVAKGDEVLDWREMAARYEKTQLHVLEGGDHALSDFDRHLPLILRFLDLDSRTAPTPN